MHNNNAMLLPFSAESMALLFAARNSGAENSRSSRKKIFLFLNYYSKIN
jgi:hypothetical protein